MPAITHIPEFFPTEFGTNWDHLCQQKLTKLRELVVIDKVNGKEKTGNQMDDAGELDPVTTRAGDTRITDQGLAKRWLRPYPHDKARLLDENDAEYLGEIALPTSEIIQGLGFAYSRSLDKAIVQAAAGTAYTGETGVTPVALPSEQKVAVNYVESGTPANSGLTIAKLRAAKFIFDDNDVDEDEMRVIAYSARQLQDLLRTTEVTNSDYNTIKALVEGKIDTYMGFKFKRVKKSFFGYDAGADVRNIVAFVRSGIHLSDSGRKVYVDIRADKSHSIQVRTVANIGASRWDEKKVVEIACDESP